MTYKDIPVGGIYINSTFIYGHEKGIFLKGNYRPGDIALQQIQDRLTSFPLIANCKTIRTK